MQVSVLIPMYNAEKWLDATLASCLQQAALKEIIICDNGSTDGSIELVKLWQQKYPELIIFKDASAVRHANYARNQAYQLASGNYIQWLDADDQLLPGKFEQQLKIFEQFPDTDIVYSDWKLNTYDKGGLLVSEENKIESQREDFLESLLLDQWLPPHAYLLSRSMADKLQQAGLWNESMPVLQDREYFTTAALIDARFSYVSGMGVVYNRWSGNSVSQAAGLSKRAQALWNQLSRYEILAAENSQLANKKKYSQIIHTLKLETATLLKKKLINTGSFFSVNWSQINGLRTRIRCFFYWLKHSLNN